MAGDGQFAVPNSWPNHQARQTPNRERTNSVRCGRVGSASMAGQLCEVVSEFVCESVCEFVCELVGELVDEPVCESVDRSIGESE